MAEVTLKNLVKRYGDAGAWQMEQTRKDTKWTMYSLLWL